MRLRSEPLAVDVAPGGAPRRVCLEGRWRAVVRVEEAWVVEGRWWGVEERREYVRLETAGAAGAPALVVELYRTAAAPEADAWRLARVVD